MGVAVGCLRSRAKLSAEEDNISKSFFIRTAGSSLWTVESSEFWISKDGKGVAEDFEK